MKRLFTWSVAWLLLAGMWLLLVGNLAWDYILAAIITATLSLLVVFLVARTGLINFAVKAEWLPVTGRVGTRLVAGLAEIFRTIWCLLVLHQQVQGEFLRVPFEARGEDPYTAARRALVTVGISFTPSSYVVAIYKKRDLMLVHQLESVAEIPGEGDKQWPI